MKKILLLLLLSLTFAAAAAGALPDHLRPLADRATLKNFPEAESVTLDDVTTVRYQADGTSVERCESWEKILTEEGRRNLRETVAHYNVFYTTIEIPVLEVIRPDGTVVKVDAAKVGKAATANTGAASNIYNPDDKIFRAALPELAVGDVVHRVIVEKNFRARMPGIWCGYFLLQSDQPVLRASVTVTGPAERPLKSMAVKDGVKGTVEALPPVKNPDGTLSWRWHAVNVPAVVPEENMPPLYTVVQRLLVSTASGWQEISRWYDALCAPRLQATSPELIAKVAELCKNAAGEEEKIARLFHYVSQEIRYLGITTEKTAPGYEPHDVKQTFDRKYGVCRDKAALLAAMLNVAGIPAHPVLFMAGTPKDGEVPNNFFNHAVVAVEQSGGRYRLLDPTGENAPLAFSSALSNMSYLVARKEGEVLRRTDVVPAGRNLVRISTRCMVDAKGSLTGTTLVQFDGVNDEIYRGHLAAWPERVRQQFFARTLKKQLPGAELLSLKLSPADLRDRKNRLTAEFTYRVKQYLPKSPSEFSLNLPEFSACFGAVNFLMNNCGQAERSFPLINFSTCGASEHFSLQLPPDCKLVSLPRPGKLENSSPVSFQHTLSLQKGNVLTGDRQLRIHAVEIPPRRYPAYRAALRRVEALLRARPLASWDYRYWQKAAGKNFPGADLLFLKDSTVIDCSVPGVWSSIHRYEFRVLTFAGLKKADHLQIAYNPVWEEVKVEAEVVLPDGSRRTLLPEEINVMDAPWVAAAPRYPAGKVLIASFPGIVPGSTVRCTVKKRYKAHPFISGIFCFSDVEPAVERDFSITAAQTQRALAISPTPYGVEMRFTAGSGGIQTNFWQATDVPAYADEPNQAPRELFALPLWYSNGKWSRYAAELNRELERRSTGQSACEALGRQLDLEAKKGTPRTTGTERELLLKKVRLIRDWAARNLRSAGPALHELPWRCLSCGDVTLKEKYGSSADRAIAIAAICRGAQVKTAFVAASGHAAVPESMKMLKRYPQPVFSTVLVRIPELDLYLNDTDEYAELGALAAHGRIGLELPGGRLFALRATRGNVPWETAKYFLKIAPDGKAELQVSLNYFGTKYAQNKRYWEKTVGRARQNALERLAAAYSRSAEFIQPPAVDFSGYPGEIKLKLKIPDFAPLQEGYRQFDLPGYAAFHQAVRTGEADRTTPFFRSAPRRMMAEWMIQLPPDSRLIATRPAQVSGGKYGSSRFSSQLKEQAATTGLHIRIRNELNLPAELLPPDEYAGLILLQKTITDPAVSRILLQRVDTSSQPITVKPVKK